MLGYITDTRVINSRPISPLILALPPPIAVIDTLVSLVSWIFALARMEIRGRAKEGSLERMHELSPVKYCSGFLRVRQRNIAVNARERRYSILPEIRLIYLLLLSTTRSGTYTKYEVF